MKKFCPNCGKELMPGAKFCTNCGKSVDSNTNNASNQVSSNQSAQVLQPKKFATKKYLIIALIVLVIVGGFGFYKYRTSPAHNPNNPLSNQTITFYSDQGQLVLSPESSRRIMTNAALIALKKRDPNSKITKYFEKYYTDIYKGKDTKEGERKYLDFNNFGEIIKKYPEEAAITTYAYMAASNIKISNPHAKQGEKVTLTIPHNPKGFDIMLREMNVSDSAVQNNFDYTPRQVTVEMMK